MATIRLRNLRGVDPSLRKRIRDALRDQERGIHHDDGNSSDLQKSKSKWRNVRTTIDGITFASKREANRYSELKLELLAGEISELELQKPFSLDVNGVHICDYVADFVYKRNGIQITEDAKGKATDLYKIKRALMRAVHGIEIIEV